MSPRSVLEYLLGAKLGKSTERACLAAGWSIGLTMDRSVLDLLLREISRASEQFNDDAAAAGGGGGGGRGGGERDGVGDDAGDDAGDDVLEARDHAKIILGRMLRISRIVPRVYFERLSLVLIDVVMDSDLRRTTRRGEASFATGNGRLVSSSSSSSSSSPLLLPSLVQWMETFATEDPDEVRTLQAVVAPLSRAITVGIQRRKNSDKEERKITMKKEKKEKKEKKQKKEKEEKNNLDFWSPYFWSGRDVGADSLYWLGRACTVTKCLVASEQQPFSCRRIDLLCLSILSTIRHRRGGGGGRVLGGERRRQRRTATDGEDESMERMLEESLRWLFSTSTKASTKRTSGSSISNEIQSTLRLLSKTLISSVISSSTSSSTSSFSSSSLSSPTTNTRQSSVIRSFRVLSGCLSVAASTVSSAASTTTVTTTATDPCIMTQCLFQCRVLLSSMATLGEDDVLRSTSGSENATESLTGHAAGRMLSMLVVDADDLQVVDMVESLSTLRKAEKGEERKSWWEDVLRAMKSTLSSRGRVDYVLRRVVAEFMLEQ